MHLSAEALFHGGHLVMRSEGCTVAKLENHLKFIPQRKFEIS